MRKYILVLLIVLSTVYVIATVYGNDKASTTDQVTKKEPIWGSTFRDMAMSITPEEKQYELGQTISIIITLKNSGKEVVELHEIRSIIRNYRFALFYPDGRPVPKTERFKQGEAYIYTGKPPVVYSRRLIRIEPGQTEPAAFSLKNWFQIDKEGTYLLVVMRRIERSWDKGFLISNMAKISCDTRDSHLLNV